MEEREFVVEETGVTAGEPELIQTDKTTEPDEKAHEEKQKKTVGRVTREMFLLKGCPPAELIEAMYPTFNESVLRITESLDLNILSELREGKKLLVLDLDRTLCNLDTLTKPRPKTIFRPYLHEFLTAAYAHYDIAIWTGSSEAVLARKIKILKINENPDYKISFFLDRRYIVRLEFEKYGAFLVKPLVIIWLKLAQFDSKNTIIVDDRPSSGLMNLENTYDITWYFKKMHEEDQELLRLIPYLTHLATDYDDFKTAKQPAEQEKLARLCNEFLTAKTEKEQSESAPPKAVRYTRSTFFTHPPVPKELIAALYPSYQKRILRKVPKSNFEMLNEPREGKKLLVLDIDHTICHLEVSMFPECIGAIRPHLHELLTAVYPFYEIAIWTASSKESMQKKVELLKILENPNYKILFCLDNQFRINLNFETHGIVFVKPLLLIWLKLPQFNSTNTIIIEDSPHVCLMNQENAIAVKRYLRNMYDEDQELSKLIPYLVHLATHCEDFKTVKHPQVHEGLPEKDKKIKPPDAKRQKLSSSPSSSV